MFSIENFYYVLYTNLLKPLHLNGIYFYPFGSTDWSTAITIPHKYDDDRVRFQTMFCDQEPLFKKILSPFPYGHTIKRINILANSEISEEKKTILKEYGLVDWYYFYHGFAALDWYNDYRYFAKVENQFTKVFMSLNRLVTNDRSYRLVLISHLIKENLIDHGVVSLHLDSHEWGTWQDELADPNSKLTADQKQFVLQHVGKLSGSIIADTINPVGSLSASCGLNDLEFNQSALWHLVSETIFYYEKLHLTEKIFKPIVTRRPFILVAGAGNLAYLKRYGFKTFSKWIDESYDDEMDNNKRLEKITHEVAKLCKLSMSDLNQMHQEMKEILDFNFNHFFGEFKQIIVKEMLQNFEGVFRKWNNGRFDDKIIDLSVIDFDAVEKLFLQ